MPRRYDYVIVGAGSAGCIVAARLSEHEDTSVLLIEQGGQRGERADMWVQRTAGSPVRPYQLGRGLGGSSSINAMIATPGLPEDYDRWERELGCTGWGWYDVQPFLDRLAVPLTHAPIDQLGDLDRALIDAAGASAAFLTATPDGERVSAARAYLEPARARRNLTVMTGAAVERVVLEGEVAVGVRVADGRTFEGAEVVLCAGAIGSPLLLLASGVRRPALGRGLKDHPAATITVRLRRPSSRDHILAASVHAWSSPIGDRDLQIVPLDHTESGPYGALVAGALQADSTGTVELIDGHPAVRFNMLATPDDRLRLREAVRRAADLARSEPFQHVIDGAYIDAAGTPLDALPAGDDDLDSWLMQHAGDHFHAACTCRMGRSTDESAVVDMAGRVHGYERLRVCDASVFPDLPRANTHVPVMLVAEKLAAAIAATPPAPA